MVKHATTQQRSTLTLTDEERAEAIRYAEWDGYGDDPVSSAVARNAAADAYFDTGVDSWRSAADLLRAGWSPGEEVTPGQRLYVAVETARRLFIGAGAVVSIREDRETAVGAAMAGPVGVTYTITAAGETP